MKCLKCNHENPGDADNCQACGAPLLNVTAKLDTQVETKRDPLSFYPGEKFGSRYQVIEEIGTGGMGKVFKARDLELNIVVALKMIKPELSSDPGIVARFKRELLLAREIVHENVIRIHDLGEINHIRYISMNYIQGNSLTEIVQATGKLTIEKSIDIAKQVSSALKAAHLKGIVHRDLKPQNIMIDKKGSAYVLDFGIARSVASTGETEAGIVLGTPDFISPEQIQGKQADASSDIYSLGIIMYEMVTGQLPFKADSPTAILYKHLHELPIPPAKLNPQIPKKLEKIILRCMEKKKKDRYKSMDQILEELEQEKTGQIKPIKEGRTDKLPGLAREEIEGVEHRRGRRLLKFVLRFFFLCLLVYGVISILSLVNDTNYRVKLEKIRGEDETYYKTLFPIQKTWLPAEWEARDSNAWDTYVKIFPANTKKGEQYKKDDEYTRNILLSPYLEKFNRISAHFQYKGIEELRDIIADYGKHFKFDDLFFAARCSKINSYQMIKTDGTLHLPLVAKYADMVAVQARVDFLEGNDEEGLRKIYYFMIFSLDLLSGSTSLAEDRTAVECFQKMCLELIPYLLSLETNLLPPAPETLEEQTAGTSAAEEAMPPASEQQPAEQGEQPQQAEQQEQPAKGGKFDSPLIRQLKELIGVTLEKLEPRVIFYKEYLSLVRSYQDIFAAFNLNKTEYYVFRKLYYWKQWFSINRYLYKRGVEFYQDMFTGLKYIRNMRDMSIFIHDYFAKHAGGNEIVRADIPQLSFRLNAARTFGKLVLIILNRGEYGLDSKEFSDLKGTDVFINEFSGGKFDILADQQGFSILLDRKFKLNLNSIDYGEEHQQLLKSFRYFDIQSEEQIRSLFYSFELE